MDTKTHFGFKEVNKTAKEKMVQDVFSTVASKYDIMNDLMSFGLHRLWKDEMIKELHPSTDEQLLDVAGGTGDISWKYIQAGGGKATVCDLNKEMLEQGKIKYQSNKMLWVHGNAEDLPFEDDKFDLYTISFGIRNVTNIDKALKEAYRVLKPNGKFVCLEFSNVSNEIIKKFYDFYSFTIIPNIGKFIANSPESYEYLVESIRKFPTAMKFESMIKSAGFNFTEYRKLCFGVVAIHIGYKV
jgi:demethylmenaquinone methyltransferase/2-methoxy-6-polyprenyl-1,4-benzoquinol methylase